jgi:hypothetical protein
MTHKFGMAHKLEWHTNMANLANLEWHRKFGMAHKYGEFGKSGMAYKI